MKIIITRPEEDAGPLSAKLEALGHVPLVMPLLKIVKRNGVVIPARAYQAICLTSANALRVLNDVSALRAVPLLAVGPQTKAMALAKGFAQVDAQGGDVVRLHQYIASNLKPADGPLLYLSGSETSGDLEGRLRASGFDVDRVMTYDAMPASLSGCAAEIISADGVVLYSPRSTKLWVKEIMALGAEAKAKTLKHFCLSPAIAAGLPQSWPSASAATPTEAALLALLEQNAKAE